MYEWLESELAAVKWKKFHVVDGPAPPEVEQSIRYADIPVTASYKEFVIKFGRARLYRQLTGGYLVGVLGFPQECRLPSGEWLCRVGHYDEDLAYFRESDFSREEESPVYEGTERGLRKTAVGFGDWLQSRCRAARKRYTAKRWAAVLQEPRPFTEAELAIVEARRLFRTRIVGLTPDDKLRFEVTNGSKLTLPYLSVGLRSKDGRIQGGAFLDVAHLRPGETAIIEKEGYPTLMTSDQLELFDVPDPEPEERSLYWEFRNNAGA